MIRKTLLTIAAATLFSGAAFASDCPNIMAAIDAALPTTTVSADVKKTVMDLRKKGEDEHKDGKHADSVATLNQAKTMLGLN